METFDSKSGKTIGYHLRLLPSGELFNRLQNTISTLAEKYDGVKFEPHVTFLARIPKASEIELIAKTKELAGMMKPFEIEPKEIYIEDAYFRALYCKAESCEELERYHQKALEMFGTQDVNVYIPHLSLYYGDVLKSVKGEMIASLSLPVSMKFLVDRIYLYRTEGEPKDWVQVGEYLF